VKSAEVAAYWEGNAEAWTHYSRRGYDVYRDALNTPAFLAMLPPVGGLCGLDVGCGEGSNTRALARRRARMHAIDIAATFIRHALFTEKADPLGILFNVADAVSLPFPDCSFDFVTAFMSMMDVPDQATAFQETWRVLRPGGFLQFSILHPCFFPTHRHVLREADGTTRAIEIAGISRRPRGRLTPAGSRPSHAKNANKLPLSHPAFPPNTERLGRDHLQRRADVTAKRWAKRQ
jgi:SAM-dependent methyltransferase